MQALFLDRDGTINFGTPTYDRVDSIDKVQLLPNTLEALAIIAACNVKVFLVTNQAGLAEGILSQETFEAINAKLLELIAPSGIEIVETYVCPHGEKSDCACRKPKPGMLLDAAQKYGIDLSESWMVGDRHTDVLTGVSAGTKTALVLTGEPNVEAPEADFIGRDLLEFAQYFAASRKKI